MTETSDILNCVHTAIVKMLLLALGCRLISFIGEERGHPLGICFAGGMSGAICASWMATGSGACAAIRIRKRRIILASILALIVAIAATIRAYLLILNP